MKTADGVLCSTPKASRVPQINVKRSRHGADGSPNTDRSEVMKTLQHMIVAAAVLVVMATPGTAKSISDQIWDQVNQTTPYKPGADDFKDAVPNRPSNDDYKDALPSRPSNDDHKDALP
jgi:hypothetical protein